MAADFDHIAERQGWTDDTRLDIMRRFIGDVVHANDALGAFALSIAAEENGEALCDECGAAVPADGDLINDQHDESCSLHPDNVTSDADVLREVGMDEAADDLDEHLGGSF